MNADAQSAQPLIRNEPDSSLDHHDHVRPEPAAVRINSFLWILTATAGIGGILFGYDTGVISATLVSIRSDLNHPLTALDKSLITAATSLFALIASPLSSLVADAWGRRPVILLASVLFVAGSAIQALAASVLAMILGRAVVGAAVGSASFVVPLYISELAPAHLRGRLVTITVLLITAGQVVAYLVGWAFSGATGGWRWMVGLGAVPALVQLLLLSTMPETPRWLVRAQRNTAARAVLTNVYGGAEATDAVVDDALRQIQDAIVAEHASTTSTRSTWRDLLLVPAHRRALAIACLLQGAQQACGFNSLMYFSATIFALVGFTQPTVPALTVACANLVFTLVAFGLIDRVGRRRMLLWSVPVMALGMALAAAAFAKLDLAVGDNAPDTQPNKDIWSGLLLAATTVYVSAYAVGLGCVPWQESELFALRVRALGSGVATATNWGANTLVGFTFLPLMQALSPSGAFVLYSLVCAASWLAIRQIYPETAGLRLEEVEALLHDGYNVKQSMANWKQRG